MTITVQDCYADWCGPCKMQDPILEELEGEWEGKVVFEKIDVDAHQDIANKYQVRSIPTIVIEDDEGVISRFVGVTQKEDLESVFQQNSS